MSGRVTRSRHSRSPSNDWVKRSLLAKVDKSSLRDITVTIYRNELLGKNDDSKDRPIKMDMDNPEAICPLVHKRRGAYTPGKVFGKKIKVNQEFPDTRKVTSHEDRRRKSRSRSRSRKYRSRSREKRRSRTPSRSRDRRRSRSESRSRSRHRKDKRRRSRSRSKYSRRHSRSRSRSMDSHEHLPECPMYRDERDRKRRSMTPLRPGEYRPGHPDLALRERRVFHRSPSPEPFKDKAMPMPMNYGYYEGYPPMMMPIPRFPMMRPTFFPRMYPPMQPRFRQRWPIVYNTGAVKNEKKPETVTSGVEEKKDDAEGVSSSDKS